MIITYFTRYGNTVIVSGMNEKIRFVLVGIVNTAVDFVVLFLFAVGLGIAPFIANIFSTTAALLTSFALNKKAVFKDTDTRHMKQFVIFVAVTLAGIWGLQGIVIFMVSWLARVWFAAEGPAVLLVGKIIATLFSLTWNYLWYSRVVFVKQNTSKE